jgi:hypothetical protein
MQGPALEHREEAEWIGRRVLILTMIAASIIVGAAIELR